VSSAPNTLTLRYCPSRQITGKILEWGSRVERRENIREQRSLLRK